MTKTMQRQMQSMSPLTRGWMRRGRSIEKKDLKKTWKDIDRRGYFTFEDY